MISLSKAPARRGCAIKRLFHGLLGILALAAAVLSVTPSAAQELMEIGKDYPAMYHKVCDGGGSIGDDELFTYARRQANADWELSKKASASSKDVVGTAIQPVCHITFASARLLKLETSIAPFPAWTLTYDSAASDTCGAAPDDFVARESRGKIRIPCTIRRQLTRFYWARLTYLNGEIGAGLLEVPERPYLLDYLRDPNRAR